MILAIFSLKMISSYRAHSARASEQKIAAKVAEHKASTKSAAVEAVPSAIAKIEIGSASANTSVPNALVSDSFPVPDSQDTKAKTIAPAGTTAETLPGSVITSENVQPAGSTGPKSRASVVTTDQTIQNRLQDLAQREAMELRVLTEKDSISVKPTPSKPDAEIIVEGAAKGAMTNSVEGALPKSSPAPWDRAASEREGALLSQLERLQNDFVAATAKQRELETERVELALTLKKNLTEVDALRNENVRLTRGIERLREKSEREISEVQQQKQQSSSSLSKKLEAAEAEASKLSKDLKERSNELDDLKRVAADAARLIKELDKQKGETVAEKSRADAAEQKLVALSQNNKSIAEQLDTLRNADKSKGETLGQMQTQLADLERKHKEAAANELLLRQQLVDAQNELLLANAQLEALNTQRPSPQSSNDVAPRRTPLRENSREGDSGAARQNAYPENSAPKALRPLSPQTQSSEVQFLEVNVDKAALRAGPGEEHSEVEHVGAGTLLMTEAKVGDWYRVLSPTGVRLFIRSDLVQVPGTVRRTAPPTAVGNPVRRRDDDSIMELIQRNSQKSAPTPFGKRVPAPQAAEPAPGVDRFDEDEERALDRLRKGLLAPQ